MVRPRFSVRVRRLEESVALRAHRQLALLYDRIFESVPRALSETLQDQGTVSAALERMDAAIWPGTKPLSRAAEVRRHLASALSGDPRAKLSARQVDEALRFIRTSRGQLIAAFVEPMLSALETALGELVSEDARRQAAHTAVSAGLYDAVDRARPAQCAEQS